MACSKEELGISDEGLCPICSDVYKAPRRLPTCGHMFCENCLFSFVFDLKEQGKIDATFDCPVCRKPIPLQTSREVVLEWVKTFPLVQDLLEIDKGSCEVAAGMSDETRVCDPCADDGIISSYKKYCLECQAYLCTACVTIHGKFKPMISHKLLDKYEISDCDNLIADFHKYRKCPKHPGRDLELFCRNDEEFICFVCASTSHKSCKKVIDVSKCSESSKEKVDKLKDRIIQTQKHLDLLQYLSHENSTSVKAQTETVEREVVDVRNRIVIYFDTIVENVAKRTKQLRRDEESKESAIAEHVERLKALFEKKLVYLDSVNKYGNTPEIFICSTQMEAEVEKLEDEVITLESTLDTSNVDRPMVDMLNKISEQLESRTMPEITIISKASDHQPKYTLPSMSSRFQVGQCKQRLIWFNPKCTPNFTGITVDDDDTMILSDSCSGKHCGYLCLYNPCQEKKHVLKMNRPCNSTMIDKQTVASTMNYDKSIVVVSLLCSMRIEKVLETKYQPRCIISLNDEKVAISWTEPPGFGIADISGSTIKESRYFTQDSDGRKFLSFDFMAINKPRKLVIQSCQKDKAVYCFDFTGKPVFKYTNNLKSPKDITVDITTGSVYVCDHLDACIHQISAKGHPISMIRHTDLKCPLNVCYDRWRKCLWVTHGYPHCSIISCFERA